MDIPQGRGHQRLGLQQSSIYVAFVAIGVLIAAVEVGLVHPTVARFGERGALQIGLVLNGAGLSSFVPRGEPAPRVW